MGKTCLLVLLLCLCFCTVLNEAIQQLSSGCSASSSETICKNNKSIRRIRAVPSISVGTTEGVAKTGNSSQNLTEEEAQLFLQQIDEEGARRANIYNHLSWSFQTNITDYNREKLIEGKIKYGEEEKEVWKRVQSWKDVWPTFKNEFLKRQFLFRSILGESALPKDRFKKLSSITSNMGETYSKGKICDFFNSSKCDLSLEPEIEHIMKTSRNYDELKYVWKAWRDKVGRPVRCQFSEMVELLNEAAAYNGFETAADYWLFDYESKSFENDVERIAKQLHPLYEQLHAYTRRKLREIYGEDKISKTGPIPAHVTGNMWAQSWINIYDILVPYPNKTSIDVSETMVNQGYTPKIMFEKADDFFASLGLERVPDSFWNNSLLEKPSGRDLVCHANAWDFSDGKDFRIKQCTRVNQNDYSTVHHELGHVQYYLQYKHLPHIFRRGANPGFHEAIGDVLDLSVSTPKHLHKVGLLETYDIDDEADINFLLKTATRKVAFLPYGYLIDKYRWNILRGLITPQNYTKAWWKYRYEYQGIEPPVERTELDFDPAAKKHVSGNIRYIRYFAAHILQFQFHKALCLLAKEYDANDPNKPLHRCDIYQSKEAGKALKEMMSLGRSKHWKEALKLLTGTDQLDASALREYFLPLENWLKANNEEHGEIAGWDGYETWLQKNKNLKNETQNLGEAQILPNDQLQNPSNDSEGKTTVDSLLPSKNQTEDRFSEKNGQIFMNELNEMNSQLQQKYMKAFWNYETNLTEHNKKVYNDIQNADGVVRKELWKKVQEWKEFWPNFQNETLKRQFKLYSVIGIPALPNGKYEEFIRIQLTLTELYGKAKVCAFNSSTNCGLSLEPELTEILRRSRNAEELKHVWKGWRDASGKPARCLFTKMVQLLNEAAILNGFPSAAELWISDYDDQTFEDDLERLYNQLAPLYQQIHSYARRKLREFYGESVVPRRGPIPAHLTGNMWAQNWENIYELLVPYPNKTLIDVTKAMIDQGYTPELMYRKGDDFFASLGLERVPESFWNLSILEKPRDREFVCHAMAVDFSDGKDFRIRHCTLITTEDFSIVQHELGHTQYQMQYKHLPSVFREGANNGFHEAIGDVVSLGVSNPKYLQKLGLLTNYSDDSENDINFLLKNSLKKIAFLPFGYFIDKYRWNVFRGKITPDNYTKAWWDYRLQYQGVNSPVPRSEFDFDPAAKFHVSSNIAYIRYFVANILQFQFYKELCLLAKEYDPNIPEKPLHKCDIYQSKEAGKKLKQILQLGKSKHWRDILKILTGSDRMDASPLLEYFRPLEEWLRIDNEKHGELVGWEADAAATS